MCNWKLERTLSRLGNDTPTSTAWPKYDGKPYELYASYAALEMWLRRGRLVMRQASCQFKARDVHHPSLLDVHEFPDS